MAIWYRLSISLYSYTLSYGLKRLAAVLYLLFIDLGQLQ